MAEVSRENYKGRRIPALIGPQWNCYACSTNRHSIGNGDIVNPPLPPNLHQGFIAHRLGGVIYRVLSVRDGLTINLEDDVTGSYACFVRWRSRIHLSDKCAVNIARNV